MLYKMIFYNVCNCTTIQYDTVQCMYIVQPISIVNDTVYCTMYMYIEQPLNILHYIVKLQMVYVHCTTIISLYTVQYDTV